MGSSFKVSFEGPVVTCKVVALAMLNIQMQIECAFRRRQWMGRGITKARAIRSVHRNAPWISLNSGHVYTFYWVAALSLCSHPMPSTPTPLRLVRYDNNTLTEVNDTSQLHALLAAAELHLGLASNRVISS